MPITTDFITYDKLITYDTKLKIWIAANTNKYELPISTPGILGGIKIGTNLKISADGTVTVDELGILTWDKISGKPTFSLVAISGNYTDLSNKPSIPTLISQLTNDKNYQTANEVTAAISQAAFLKFEKVAILPPVASAKINVIYLVSKIVSGQDNVFEEWMIIDGKWESLGTTAIELSNYWTKDELVEVTNAQIDALFS